MKWLEIDTETTVDGPNKDLSIVKVTKVLQVGPGTVLKTEVTIWRADQFIDYKESVVYLPEIIYRNDKFTLR